jgi:hypothetical protein
MEDGAAGRRVGARARRGEEVLPGEARRGARHLVAERVGEIDLAAAGCKLRAVTRGDPLDLRLERVAQAGGQERRPVVLALAAANHDLAALEVHVLDAKGDDLGETEAAAVHEVADQAKRRLELVEHGAHVGPGEHRREMLGALGTFEARELRHGKVEHAAIQEDDGAEGLVLRGGRGAALLGEMIEESGDLGSVQLPRVAAAVEADEGSDPVGVGFLGARRVVQAPEGAAQGFE